MKVTAHIHGRIVPLIQEAVEKGLIISCEPTVKNTYLLRKTNESNATEYPPITTGVILLHLLKKL
jgi:hypothetical protein